MSDSPISPGAARGAPRSSQARIEQHLHGAAAFEGVTVQRMVTRKGTELILGASTDAQFGPVLLFGTGGTLVEVFKDRALGLPPLTTTLARRMMERTKIYKALGVLERILKQAGFTTQRVTFSHDGTADIENLYARIGTKAPHLTFAGHINDPRFGYSVGLEATNDRGDVRLHHGSCSPPLGWQRASSGVLTSCSASGSVRSGPEARGSRFRCSSPP